MRLLLLVLLLLAGTRLAQGSASDEDLLAIGTDESDVRKHFEDRIVNNNLRSIAVETVAFERPASVFVVFSEGKIADLLYTWDSHPPSDGSELEAMAELQKRLPADRDEECFSVTLNGTRVVGTQGFSGDAGDNVIVYQFTHSGLWYRLTLSADSLEEIDTSALLKLEIRLAAEIPTQG